MSKKITTRYKASRSGAGRIYATSNGKTISIPYPHELSQDERHRAAAQALADKFGWTLGSGDMNNRGGYTFERNPRYSRFTDTGPGSVNRIGEKAFVVTISPREAQTAEQARGYFKTMVSPGADVRTVRQLPDGRWLVVARRAIASNPELLTVGFNPHVGELPMFAVASNPRKRRRSRIHSKRRRRGGKRSWKAFIRRHKRVLKRLGFKRGMKRLGVMFRKGRK